MEEHSAILAQHGAELARMQEELHLGAEQLRILVEAAFEGIVFQEQFRIADCNEQLAALLGYTRQELLGRDLLEFLPPEERELVRRAVQERQAGTLELHARHKDGTWRTLEVQRRNLAGSEMHLAIVRDVTDGRQAEEVLKRSE